MRDGEMPPQLSVDGADLDKVYFRCVAAGIRDLPYMPVTYETSSEAGRSNALLCVNAFARAEARA